MLKVTQHDYHFYKLVDFIQNPPAKASELVSVLQALRAKFSLHWIEPLLKENPEACISSILLTLFTLANTNDPNVKINVYSALGAFILTITPFAPIQTLRGLSVAIQSAKADSPSTSIAIISSFLYLLKFVNPLDLDKFIINTPVLHHFSVDVSDFIQHVPHLVKLMKKLPIQFHQNFLRSLLISFGRNPNHYYVNSTIELILLNPQTLISDLMSFCIGNKLDQSILAFGPQLIGNDQIYPVLTDEYRNLILDLGFDTLQKENTNLSEFEQATGLLSAYSLRLSGEDFEKFSQKINSITKSREYPKHFVKLLLMLPTSFDDLKINEEDPGSLRCTKFKALSYLMQQTQNLDTIKLVINEFKANLNSNGDPLTALIISISESVDKMIKYDKEGVKYIIYHLIAIENMTWVQQNALVKLLDKITLDGIYSLDSNLEKLVVKIIVNYAFAQQDELSRTATKVVKNFVTLDNFCLIDEIISKTDIFDSDSCVRYLSVLNAVSCIIPFYKLIKHVYIVCELVEFHTITPQVADLGFKFISKFKIKSSQNLRDFTLDWVCRLYKSVTQNDPPIQSLLKYDDLPALISTLETDIVASDLSFIDKSSSYSALLSSFLFLMEINPIICTSFMSNLVKIFPDEIIPCCTKIFENTKTESFVNFAKSVLNIVTCSSSLHTLSICADFFCNCGQDFITNISNHFLGVMNESSLNATELKIFYQIAKTVDENQAQNRFEQIKSSITDDLELFLLNIKTNQQPETIPETIKFDDWPILDTDFASYVKSLQNYNVNISDSTDDKHIMFALKYDNVRIANLDQFSKKYPKRFSRFIQKIETREFHEKITTNCSKKATISNTLPKGEISTEISLIKSFFRFSTQKITQTILDNLIESFTIDKIDEDLFIAMASYCERHNLIIKEEIYNKFMNSTNENVLKCLKLNEKALNDHKDENLIDKLTNKYTITDVIIKNNISQYLKTFLSSFVVKSKNFIKLTIFLSKFNVSPEYITEFNFAQIKKVDKDYSSKKITSLLRMIRAHFASINPNLQSNDASMFRAEYIGLLHPFMRANDTARKELSGIFAYFFRARGPGDKLLSDLDEHERSNSRIETFSMCLCEVFSFANSGNMVKRGYISNVLSLELPSSKIHGLECVTFLLRCPYKVYIWEAIYDCLWKSESAISFLRTNPAATRIISDFTISLCNYMKFDNIRSEFLPKLSKTTMVRSSDPRFSTFIDANCLLLRKSGNIKLDSQLMINSFSVVFSSGVSRILSSYYEYLTRTSRDNIDFVVDYIKASETIFRRFRNVETCLILSNALCMSPPTFDPMFIVVGQICINPDIDIFSVVFLSHFIRTCKPEFVDKFVKSIEEVRSIINNDELYSAFIKLSRREYEDLLHFVLP